MVVVPSPDKVVDKWQRKASAATEDYRAGVETPRRSWKEAVLAAADAYYAALQNVINQDLWRKALAGISEDEWKRKAIELGVRRYADGVRANADKYAKKMSKVLAILKELTLPPRGPRGDPKNLDRVRVIMEALHKAKIEGRI